MLVGIVKETFPGETRVALIPSELSRLAKKNIQVIIERGVGDSAGHADADYVAKGATVAANRSEVFTRADVVAQVRTYGANVEAGEGDLALYKAGQVVLGFMDPLGQPQSAKKMAEHGAQAMAMELIPRITRAQSMDALSSMANLAGYKAVLMAACELPKIFPMMMTAAGSLTPARVFVLGAGVAGLQAIATAKRLGAVIYAYDIRPEVKEQVQSVGAKFVELDITTDEAGDKGGYAKAQSDDFYKKQQELMTAHVAEADVVITTAAVPGRKAPILVTEAMVDVMKPGAVVVDLAAETGGNCALTQAGEVVLKGGVKIMGPTNVPASMPVHASQTYARNISTLLLSLVDDDGNLVLNMDDEVIAGALVAKDKNIVHPRVLKALEG